MRIIACRRLMYSSSIENPSWTCLPIKFTPSDSWYVDPVAWPDVIANQNELDVLSEMILVAFWSLPADAAPADEGNRSVCPHNLANWNYVSPNFIEAPGLTKSDSTLLPSTLVPELLPRASMRYVPSVTVTRAWCRLTVGSSITISLSGDLPMVKVCEPTFTVSPLLGPPVKVKVLECSCETLTTKLHSWPPLKRWL